MVRRFIIFLACLLLLSIVPIAFAQELGEEITDSGFTYRYPTEWVSEIGRGGITLASNETMLNLDADGETVPADLLRVTIATREFVKYATAGESSPKTAAIVLASFLQVPGEMTMGIFENADYARFAGFDPLIDALFVVYALDFGSSLTLITLVMGSDYDEEPAVVIDILTSITYSPPPRPSITNSTTMSYGDEFDGVLTEEAGEQVLVFEGSLGDLVTITMTSETFDTTLRLYSQTSDVPLIVNDDTSFMPQDINSRITYFQLPEDGTYIIAASAYRGGGEYKLTLKEGIILADERITLFENSDPTIAYGDVVTGVIGSGQLEQEVYYLFEGSAGDIITISMIAENEDELDTQIKLYAASAYSGLDTIPIARNDDHRGSNAVPGNYNSQITSFILPEDGKYLIIATRIYGTGEFTLTLEEENGR
jgi:hypothetical protein